ncbi:glycosyltransferase family 2 protein [candidate division WOR-3 bacterium]|nr:glycosyltransferase family 2 protein [candidate division WOR-3 bacterium]
MGQSPEVKVSLLVPAYNEVDNVEPLLAELGARLDSTYEVIVCDDGSDDGTFERAKAAQARYPFLKVCRLGRNQGKTAAILRAFEEAGGAVVSILDADLQFMPEDVVKQVAKLGEGFDLVTGRKVGHYEKRGVSGIYNWLARRLFGLKVRDINALKTFRREVLEEIGLRKDWHRYIVPLAAARGFSVTEVDVTLRPRHAGRPKYSGRRRVFIGLLDLVAVAFQVTFMRKPMLWFGALGTVTFAAGVAAGAVAIVLRLLGHGFRPLLYLVMLLVVAGLLFYAAGFLGESLAGMSDRLERVERRLRERAGRPPEKRE